MICTVNWLLHPVDWWVEPFTDNPFLRDALWAALLSVLCTSVIGTWVVLRGLTFLGDALAHGVLPGIAIAFVTGGNTSVGALIAALAMVIGVQLIRAGSPLPDDASIGVLFVGFLALAVVVMSAQDGGGAGDLTRFLFGSINAVDSDDLRTLLAVSAITVGGVLVLHRALMVGTFDATQARLLGFRPQLTHFALLVLLALSIVASFETVGSLLRGGRPADQLPPRDRDRGDDGARHRRGVLDRTPRAAGGAGTDPANVAVRVRAWLTLASRAPRSPTRWSTSSAAHRWCA